MIVCPAYYLMCKPGYEHYKWNPSMGGCNLHPCGNICVPCKDLSNCEGDPLIQIDPILPYYYRSNIT